jgi:hypothetical protein
MPQVTLTVDPRVETLLREAVYAQLHIAADELSDLAADFAYLASVVEVSDELRAVRRRVVAIDAIVEQFGDANGEAASQVTMEPEFAERLVASAIEGVREDLYADPTRPPQELRAAADHLEVLQATLDELGAGVAA